MTKLELTKLLHNDERYCRFIILDEAKKFMDLFNNQNIDVVQVHCIISGFDLIGFSGCFEWHDNQITTLDGDDYDTNMEILAYEYFDLGNDIKGLDIIINNFK